MDEKLLTSYEYHYLCDASKKYNYMLTCKEKKSVELYLDDLNSKKYLNDSDSKYGIMQLVAYGPICFSGGLKSYRENPKNGKCCHCDRYHE
jgi:hypothetical protein